MPNAQSQRKGKHKGGEGPRATLSFSVGAFVLAQNHAHALALKTAHVLRLNKLNVLAPNKAQILRLRTFQDLRKRLRSESYNRDSSDQS